MIFSTRYWGLVPFTVFASETVRFAILDVKLDSRLLHRYSTIIIKSHMTYRFSPVRWMQSEEAPSLNFLFFSSSDLDAQCLGLHLQFSREGESSVYDQAKI